MPIPITITLNSIVGTPGPFDLYSCTGSTCSGTPFVTGVTATGNVITSSDVPNGTTSIKIKSTGAGCDYEITKSIVGLPTNTPTPTPTPTSPTNTPTPTTTSTVTPTPTSTQIVGQCYRYRIDENSPINGQLTQYGIRYTYPGSISSDNALSSFMSGLITVDGNVYNTYSICSSVEPTWLEMTTLTSGTGGVVPNGVFRDGPLGGCSGNSECL
jgi:hypothetical protein